MKWFADFFGKKKDAPLMKDENWFPSNGELVSNPAADRQVELGEWSDELFNLCWEREALYVEIDTAKRQKKKSSHLIAALAKNTARRLEIELAHNGKRA